MRRRLLAAAVVLGTVLTVWLAPAAVAVRPPAGIPDLSAMSLTAGDVPAGAIVERQGYVRDPDARAAYLSKFSYSGSAMDRSRLVMVQSGIELFPHVGDALFEFVLVDAVLADRGSRLRIARQVARQAGLRGGKVTAGRPRHFHLGDGAFGWPITVTRHHRRSTFVVALMALDRVSVEIDVLGAPGNRHVLRRTRSLLALTRDRIRRGLSPLSTSPPTITGTAKVGAVLHAEPGTWSDATGPAAFTYQWQRCDATGAACAPIAGATTRTYTVTAQDAGATLRVAVTARNRVGRTTAVSSVVSPTA